MINEKNAVMGKRPSQRFYDLKWRKKEIRLAFSVFIRYNFEG